MALTLIASSPGETVTPVYFVTPDNLDNTLGDMSDAARQWVAASAFKAKSGESLCIPGLDGEIAAVLFGAPKEKSFASAFQCARLLRNLPSGAYRFVDEIGDPHLNALALKMQDYRFDRYRKSEDVKEIAFVIDDDKLRRAVEEEATAVTLVRDLINTPTNDMGPAELGGVVKTLAKTHGARFSETIGDDLLTEGFPMIHTVGRASAMEPRLLDMRWGREELPKVTLVGKGVCFDSGGLNIKTGNFMTLMKKDMGGAANVLGLAKLIMSAELPVRLRVLIPAVENAISGNAFRPGDVLASRAGISVEISNTDAEGRLVLGDALTLADEEAPDLLIDMATLTGAARVALGPEVPPFYTHDDEFADELMVRAQDAADPVWRMPLWVSYESMLDSSVADINHAASGGFAGSITAALFLKKFVKNAATWAHFDVYGWTPTAKPGFPKGGEAQAIRALFNLIKARYPA